MKHHQTLRQLFVHPKDKRSAQNSVAVVYSIPCKNCPRVTVGETGKRYEVREKEHRKDVNQLEGVKNTRNKKKESQTEHHQSALMGHAAVCIHTIDWEGMTLQAKDPDWSKRGIRTVLPYKL